MTKSSFLTALVLLLAMLMFASSSLAATGNSPPTAQQSCALDNDHGMVSDLIIAPASGHEASTAAPTTTAPQPDVGQGNLLASYGSAATVINEFTTADNFVDGTSFALPLRNLSQANFTNTPARQQHDSFMSVTSQQYLRGPTSRDDTTTGTASSMVNKIVYESVRAVSGRTRVHAIAPGDLSPAIITSANRQGVPPPVWVASTAS